MTGLTECQPEAAALRQHTPTPWQYRPDHYDDWGWIKGPDGKLAAVARAAGEYDADEHRTAGTDPYGANAAFIVEAVNSHATLQSRVDELTKALKASHDSLRDWLAFAEEELSEFDVDAEECSGEKLCPKCESSGCIKLKIDNTRSALSLEQSGSGK